MKQNTFKNILIKMSLFSVILFLGWIIIATIFKNGPLDNVLSSFNTSRYTILLFLGAGLFLAILYFIYQFFKKKHFHSKKLWILSGLLFFILIVLQYSTKNLLVEPSWDFGHLYNGALDFMKGTLDYPYTWNYLSGYPNNLFMFVCEVIMVNLANVFRVLDYNLFCWFCNAIMIDLAVIFLFLFMKKVHSMEMAIMSLLLCLFVTPIVLYTPIFYTDTFSILFPILLFYLYSFIRNKEITKRNVWIILLMGFITVIGMNIKFTVLIASIAIIIDSILQQRFKKNVLLLLIFLVGSGLGLLSVFMIEQPIKKHYNLDAGLQMPFTHWIMIGLKGNGTYNAEDLVYTESFLTKQEKIDANVLKIKERLRNFGIHGYLKFLNHKLTYTWSDGTYYVTEKLNRLPVSTDSFISSVVIPEGKFFKAYILFANIIHTALMILLLLGAVTSFYYKKYDRFALYISILGIGLFLLIWETRSRYLYNFIPIFIAAALPTLDSFTFKRNQKVSEVNSK